MDESDDFVSIRIRINQNFDYISTGINRINTKIQICSFEPKSILIEIPINSTRPFFLM